MLSVRRTNDLCLCYQIPAEINLSCENVETVNKNYNGGIVEGIIYNFKAFFVVFRRGL